LRETNVIFYSCSGSYRYICVTSKGKVIFATFSLQLFFLSTFCDTQSQATRLNSIAIDHHPKPQKVFQPKRAYSITFVNGTGLPHIITTERFCIIFFDILYGEIKALGQKY
jgi:hypothetical protein